MEIILEYSSNKSFHINKLITHMKKSNRNYIIIGSEKSTLNKHKKSQSLDYWLRTKIAGRDKDIMQSSIKVVKQIIATGKFKGGKYKCPETGYICKGIELL